MPDQPEEKRRRKPSPEKRNALSVEAARLILDGTGEWEHVQIGDGDAAQKMAPGIKARPPVYEALPVEALDDEKPDPDQLHLPDFD